MLACVFACAGLILLTVFVLGGNTPVQSPPVILMNTAAPTLLHIDTPAAGSAQAIADPLAEVTSEAIVPPRFALAGPTLAPVILTATPGVIDIGAVVRVVDVGDQQLNIRDAPGVTSSSIVFRVTEGIAFTVVGGPQQADGLTWWQIALADNPARVGWTASNYLEFAAP